MPVPSRMAPPVEGEGVSFHLDDIEKLPDRSRFRGNSIPKNEPAALYYSIHSEEDWKKQSSTNSLNAEGESLSSLYSRSSSLDRKIQAVQQDLEDARAELQKKNLSEKESIERIDRRIDRRIESIKLASDVPAYDSISEDMGNAAVQSLAQTQKIRQIPSEDDGSVITLPGHEYSDQGFHWYSTSFTALGGQVGPLDLQLQDETSTQWPNNYGPRATGGLEKQKPLQTANNVRNIFEERPTYDPDTTRDVLVGTTRVGQDRERHNREIFWSVAGTDKRTDIGGSVKDVNAAITALPSQYMGGASPPQVHKVGVRGVAAMFETSTPPARPPLPPPDKFNKPNALKDTVQNVTRHVKPDDVIAVSILKILPP
jgi:hypothetical protein